MLDIFWTDIGQGQTLAEPRGWTDSGQLWDMDRFWANPGSDGFILILHILLQDLGQTLDMNWTRQILDSSWI